MSINTTNQSIIAFKNLSGKSMTDPSKGLNNETETILFNSPASSIWVQQISPTASVAVSQGVAIAVTASLTVDPSSNGLAYFASWPVTPPSGTDLKTGNPFAYGLGSLKDFAAGQRVRNAIPTQFDTLAAVINRPNSYQAKVFGGATEITLTDIRGWTYQYNSGIYWQQSVASPNPTSVAIFVYIGDTLASGGGGIGSITGVTAGTGLSGGGTQGAITLDMNWGGTASGTTFSNDAIIVSVDDTTIKINNSGQLTVVAGASSPVYDRFTMPLTTSGDDSSTGLFLTSTPNDYSRIQVFVNGQLQRLGNNSNSLDCYFGTQSSTPKSLSDLLIGDELYWNGVVAGYDLTTTDVVDIVYEA